jgi:hypothetical protein
LSSTHGSPTACCAVPATVTGSVMDISPFCQFRRHVTPPVMPVPWPVRRKFTIITAVAPSSAGFHLLRQVRRHSVRP